MKAPLQFKKIFLFIVTISLFAGCTHSLHLAHVSDFSPSYKAYQKGTLVKATGEQFTVMGMVGNTDYVEMAYQQLQSQCPRGSIQGITTLFSTSHGFFSWTNYVDLQGLCLQE